MGRGDRRTAKGKRFKGSFGISRKAKPVKKAATKKAPAPKATKKAAPKAKKKKED